jgi:hypothetical protein
MTQKHRHFVKDNFWNKRFELHRMTLDDQAKGGKWLVTACLVRSGGREIRGQRQASSTSISGFARPQASHSGPSTCGRPSSALCPGVQTLPMVQSHPQKYGAWMFATNGGFMIRWAGGVSVCSDGTRLADFALLLKR